MADTGKLKPEVTMRGLFLPWTLVATLLLAVCGAVGVPVLDDEDMAEIMTALADYYSVA